MNLNSAFLCAKKELFDIDIKTGELDAKVLLLAALDKDEGYLIKNRDFSITNSEYSKFRRYIRRRKKGEPVAYIVGHKEFYGLDFKVNKNVLIPRPESELLVEETIKFLKTESYKLKATSLNIIDIGTGSGCIVISLANFLQTTDYGLQTKLFAADVSEKALRVAKFNAKKHGVNKHIKFYHSDLFENKRLPKKFDLIIANLPYLKPDYKNLDYEPRLALDGGKGGLKVVRKLLDKLSEKLISGGIALLEIDNDQPENVKKYLRKYPELKMEIIQAIQNWNNTIKITKQ